MAGVGRMVKESIVRDATEQLKGRSNLFIASVSRLKASEASTFRRQLSSSQARLIMIKRRLGKRALADLKLPGLEALMEGSVGFVLPGEDVLPIAKLLVGFSKAHEEQLTVRGALIDGQLLDGKEVKALADLPPRPVLLAQVLGTIEAPMADVIFTIEQLIGDLAWLAEEAAKTKPQAAPEAGPATEAGTPPVAGSPTGVPGAAGERPTEAGTPPAGRVAEGSPDTAGGRIQPSEQQNPKPEGGPPA